MIEKMRLLITMMAKIPAAIHRDVFDEKLAFAMGAAKTFRRCDVADFAQFRTLLMQRCVTIVTKKNRVFGGIFAAATAWLNVMIFKTAMISFTRIRRRAATTAVQLVAQIHRKASAIIERHEKNGCEYSRGFTLKRRRRAALKVRRRWRLQIAA